MRPLQNVVEFLGRQLGVARHIWQLAVDLADEDKIGPPGTARSQQIERDIGIAAQAIIRLAVTHALSDQLTDHIDLAVEHITQRMGVVGGDIVALRRLDIEPAAREEKKFIDLDVRRHAVFPQRFGIGESRIAVEQPRRNRLEEAPLEILLGARLLQRQSGKDAQRHRRIAGGAIEQGIGDVVGFAEPQWQCQHDILADPLDDRFGQPVRIVEINRSAVRARIYFSRSQPGSGWKRSPYFVASR